MPDAVRCPQCDALLPADSVGGLCPQCLLRLAMATAPNAPDTMPMAAGASAPEEQQFGPYLIVRVLGEGGMGTVYLAEQQEPICRRVALKVIKLGMSTREVMARFDSERQALALMDHPHIARVFDAGASEQGRPYFVMEYVDGIPITEYCDRHRLNNGERIELFIAVCQAVHHAHQKGIIHRDIKPSNVLVAEQDGQPFPKVIDFGVAKAVDQRAMEQATFTQMGSLVGTPEYMSPEQTLLNANIDTTTDVYSLGVLLYELLAGTLPFKNKRLREAGLAELLRIIREEDPPTPSDMVSKLPETTQVAERRRTNPALLRRQLTGDLNWIVMKALEKERRRRYASVSELAADIRRHLENHPVLAGPPNRLYRARKFVQRHRMAVTAGTLVAASLVAGVVVATWQAEVARVEYRRAEARTQQVRTLALSMLDQIDSQLRRLPNSAETRKLLLQKAIQALNTLAAPSDEPYVLEVHKAESYKRSENHPTPTMAIGWLAAGYAPERYEMGVDRTVFHSGSASGYIASKTTAKDGDWATLTQTIRAENYRGRRIRLSAFIRTKTVREGAHLWLRVDALGASRAFDGMQEKPIRGTTDWNKYEAVLDVTEDSVGISFGIFLIGRLGKAWIDDLNFEVVDNTVPVTGGWEHQSEITLPSRPINLGFEDQSEEGPR